MTSLESFPQTPGRLSFRLMFFLKMLVQFLLLRGGVPAMLALLVLQLAVHVLSMGHEFVHAPRFELAAAGIAMNLLVLAVSMPHVVFSRR